MILRSPITSTKKFFQKTLKNFKSLFSSDYQRLPKCTTPSHPNHLSYSLATTNDVIDMNKNNTSTHDFNDQYESENEKARRTTRIMKKGIMLSSSSSSSSPTKQEYEVYKGRSYIKLSNATSPSCDKVKNKKRFEKGKEHKERKYCMVEEKLRELEMLDMSNVDYVMDIEEVIYYYSRLTCPAYLEIVDRFFIEMFGPTWPSLRYD